MKNKKLLTILVSSFIALCLVVAGVVTVFSQLEKNPIGADDTTVKHSGKDTLVFRDTEFVTGNIITCSDEKLKDCVLLLNDQRGLREIYPSKYAPLFGETDTKYYYRNSGNIICEKITLEKSKYQRIAYSKQTFELPEFNLENIKKINVCYGNYYDSAAGHAIDGISDFFSAAVDGNCPIFNLMKYHEIDTVKDIKNFIYELNQTGNLEKTYEVWRKNSGKENIFFQVVFADSSIPCSLLFTKDAIFA